MKNLIPKWLIGFAFLYVILQIITLELPERDRGDEMVLIFTAFIIILGQPTDVITLFMRCTTLFMYGPLRVTGNAQTPPEILPFMTRIGCAISICDGLDVMYM